MNSPLRLCALTALLVSNAAAQTADLPTLVRTGDVLGDGATIERIVDIAVAEAGDWMALVETDQGGFEDDGALLHNGVVVVREGTTLPSGETIGQVLGLDLASDGAFAWTHRVSGGTSSTDEVLYVDGAEVLRTGATISGPGIPAGALVSELRDLRYEGGRLLLVGALSASSPDFRVLLEVDLTGAAPAYRLLARVADTPIALSGPISIILSQFDLAEDGSFAAVIGYTAPGGALEKAILTDLGWRAIQGTTGPIAGTTWRHSSRVEVAAVPGGGVLVSSDLETSTGVTPGVVFQGGSVLAYEGDPFGPLAGETTYFFGSAPVDVGAGGELAWIAPVAVFDDVLVLDGEAVLRETATTVEGSAIGNSLTTSSGRSLGVARGGRQASLLMPLASGGEA
ncbi:MAG: hypothetical protein AAFP86_13175, partial [Planctomycetota bacterium]